MSPTITACAPDPIRDSPGGTDAELIATARRNADPRSSRALARLLQRHRGWVLRRCLRWLGNRDDAEDAVQDVMVRVWRGLASLDDPALFGAWVARTADNRCKTLLARRPAWVTSTQIDDLLETGEHCAPSPEHGESTSREARHRLRALPGPAREVLELRYLNELSLDQVAARLELSLSATKMRIYRALASCTANAA